MEYKHIIAEKLSEITGVSYKDILEMIEVPKENKMGDFALPCFKLSRTLRKAPNQIADDLKEKFSDNDYLSKVKSVNGYLNFFIDKISFAKQTLTEIIQKGDLYGSSDEGNGQTICIDYSSVNGAKPLHLGHLYTTAIGHSLYQIYEFLGYNCVGINHLGDYGTQYGTLIVAYEKWGNKEKVDQYGVEELTRLYVKYHEEEENHPELADQARMWFKKVEDKNPEALELFNWLKEITLKEVHETYNLLGIEFDYYTGESFYTDKMQPVIDKLIETRLLVKDQGAQVVRLDDYDMPPCIMLRSDGASLYATRDMATALYRKQTFNFSKCLYVVAYHQDLHFKQFFKVLELAGYEWSDDLFHVNYGMVSLEDGAMSTRKGRMVLLKDLLSRAIEKATDIIEGKNPELENKEKIAKMIGVGSIVFSALKNNRIKDLVFSWDKALNFDGETAPYVQYTHARANSVLNKSNILLDDEADYSELDNDEAAQLITALADFEDIIKGAARRYEPSMITRYVVEVAQKFNKYYFDHRIIDNDNEKKNRARLLLTKASMQVIKTALELIGVEAPNQM
ncbi:MAG: arginine--tRNA ligase [Clostridiales bacterium]|nr:arginine--tRNA ligase [Clostridiales bacterium]